MIGKSKASLIIEDFESKIRSGQLKKGDRLPNETDYANQLGVNRGSLREAIKILKMMGAVSQKPKVGIVIICDNPNLWLRQPNEDILKAPETKEHLIDARLIIEPEILRMCIERIDSDGMTELQKNVNEAIKISEHLKTKTDYEQYVDGIIQFHSTILITTGNPFFIETYPVILQITKRYLLETLMKTPQYVQDLNILLNSICDAINRKAYDEAAVLTKEYIHITVKN